MYRQVALYYVCCNCDVVGWISPHPGGPGMSQHVRLWSRVCTSPTQSCSGCQHCGTSTGTAYQWTSAPTGMIDNTSIAMKPLLIITTPGHLQGHNFIRHTGGCYREAQLHFSVVATSQMPIISYHFKTSKHIHSLVIQPTYHEFNKSKGVGGRIYKSWGGGANTLPNPLK